MTCPTKLKLRGLTRLSPILLVALAACAPDETISAYAGGRYQLVELDGAPFDDRALLDVSEPGRITGDGPCNSYFAPQTAPYPWFEVGPIGASRRACPALDVESAYFAALRAMEFAESAGDILILSNTAGEEMVFQVAP